MPQKYWLSRECFLCTAKGRAVLLDTRTASYLEFDFGLSESLRLMVHGWPDVPRGRNSQVSGRDVNEGDVVSYLLSQGILVTEKRFGRNAAPTTLNPGAAVLLDEYERMDVTVGRSDLIQFVRAVLSAMKALSLRKRRTALRRILRKLRCTRVPGGALEPSAFEIDEMKRTLAIFRALRPLLPRMRHREWFEKLILWNFMRYRGQQSDLVLAVSENPLISRMWLQRSDIVIDDSPGLVSQFTPIMVV